MNRGAGIAALLAAGALLCGCAGAGGGALALEGVAYDRDAEPYPFLSIYRKRPSAELVGKCAEFNGQSKLHHCAVDYDNLHFFRAVLEETKLFEGVGFAIADSDYSLSIAMARYNAEKASELATLAVSASSLFIIPSNLSHQMEVEMELKWRGVTIKRYNYELPYNISLSIFSSIDKGHMDLAEDLAARFLQDYQADKAWSGGFILSALNASDYDAGLAIPEQTRDYAYKGKRISNDPLSGVRVLYEHKIFPDVIEVIVYPVRGAEWSDWKSVLSAEVDLIREERQLGKQQGMFADVNFSAQEEVRIKLKDGVASGLKFDYTVSIEGKGYYYSLSYMFIEKDKIIKIRKVEPFRGERFNMDDFVAEILNGIEPPGESAFMAQVRLHGRKNVFFLDRQQMLLLQKAAESSEGESR